MARRNVFLEKYNKDERVERIVFSRGCYNIDLKDRWYSLRGGKLSQWNYYLTTMKEVEGWIEQSIFVGGDLKEVECKIVEIKQGHMSIEAWDKKMKSLEEEWGRLEKAIADKKAEIKKLEEELGV